MANFEESLKQLEEIVARLEKGDLILSDSLQLFEKGVSLSKECKQELDQAESRIRILVEQQNGNKTPEPFSAE